MELSVDQKIQAAIQPLLDRITALENDTKNLKQEIVTLQTANQSKLPHKPDNKPGYPRVERVHTTKPTKNSSEHHDEKPEIKPVNRVPGKKEEVKVEHEAKGDSSKVGSKTPVGGNKVTPSPHVNKDNNKARPVTAVGLTNNKSGLLDKKPVNHKPNESKKEEEKKEHHSKEKDSSKVGPGLKSPGPVKKTDKKPAAPLPTNTVGKKSVHGKPGHPIPDAKVAKHADMFPESEVKVPDEVAVHQEAINNPYTPEEEGEKKVQEVAKEEVVEEEAKKVEQAKQQTEEAQVEEVKGEEKVKEGREDDAF